MCAAGARAFSAKPDVKPVPNFGSGPCKKRPGWSLGGLSDNLLGRSHRSAEGKALLAHAIDESKRLLELPEGYELGIVPASDTGAFEMCMWSMLGPRPVDVCHWEAFGKGWFGDITTQLKLDGVREFGADYGKLPDLASTNPDHDVIFTWNGTTSGVRVPDGEWIRADRGGLTMCDATSAVFAMEMPWDKLDVTTYSWQKVLGGEGAHGVVVLSPRAIERLESYTPAWPLPKIFRMTKAGKFSSGIFGGSTINTPSMLCVEDYVDALKWADAEGGLAGLVAKSQGNLGVMKDFVDATPWASFLAKDPATCSSTSMCFEIDGASKEQLKEFTNLLDAEQVAYDIGSYRDAPPGLRIWGGATVEQHDLEQLVPWLHYAHAQTCA